jgi:hypothetical protein
MGQSKVEFEHTQKCQSARRGSSNNIATNNNARNSFQTATKLQYFASIEAFHLVIVKCKLVCCKIKLQLSWYTV